MKQVLNIHINFYLLIAFLVIGLSACSDFQKVTKSTDVAYKYEKAVEYFNKKDYYRAGILFEELIPLFRGRKESEMSQYYYAYCHYYQGQLTLASYYFESFVRTYPRSDKVEECSYMNLKSLFYSTPDYNLDQSTTNETLGAIQIFLQNYPNSEYREECLTMITDLQKKLELKAYHNAKLYHQLRYYKSAVITLQNFIKKYPTSTFVEEMLFLKFDSQLALAKISVERKQKERYLEAISFYQELVDSYPKGEYIKKAENLYDQALSGLEKTKENN